MNWRDYFTYYPETGILTWKDRPLSAFPHPRAQASWNARYAGKTAGCSRWEGGYKRTIVRIASKNYPASRVIWEMIHGPIPDGQVVDHRDRDATNNRLHNLRLAKGGDNQRNSARLRRSNTSGYKGVCRSRHGRWEARIKKDCVTHNLGTFKTPTEAAEAYDREALILHGQFASVNFPEQRGPQGDAQKP